MRTATVMHWITFRAISWNLMKASALRPLLRHVKHYRWSVQNDQPPPELPAAVDTRASAVLVWSVWKVSIDKPVMFVFGLIFLLPSMPYLIWGLYRVTQRFIGEMF